MSVAKRTAALIVLGIGVVLLFVAVFVPWATLKWHQEDDIFGESFDARLQYNLWDLEFHSSFYSDSVDYSDMSGSNDGEDSGKPEGLGLLRTGGPMLSASLGLGGLGAILLLVGLFTSHGLSKTGAWLAVGAGAVALIGVVLFLAGLHSNAGETKDDAGNDGVTLNGPYPHVGYFFAPLGALAILVGGFLGFARARVVPGAAAGYGAGYGGGYPGYAPPGPAPYGAPPAARPAFSRS
ncbi:MAG TPA: hypothetical protein VI796_06075, partial [Candidatus Thermoplasmatota archaeon]|nr:hypothetical protein [Candidatus Thermoplasmatota archaeon]